MENKNTEHLSSKHPKSWSISSPLIKPNMCLSRDGFANSLLEVFQSIGDLSRENMNICILKLNSIGQELCRQILILVEDVCNEKQITTRKQKQQLSIAMDNITTFYNFVMEFINLNATVFRIRYKLYFTHNVLIRTLFSRCLSEECQGQNREVSILSQNTNYKSTLGTLYAYKMNRESISASTISAIKNGIYEPNIYLKSCILNASCFFTKSSTVDFVKILDGLNLLSIMYNNEHLPEICFYTNETNIFSKKKYMKISIKNDQKFTFKYVEHSTVKHCSALNFRTSYEHNIMDISRHMKNYINM